MKTYRGSCHCGEVLFEIVSDLAKATECNCSICTKKGAIHHRVPPERFRLLSGQDFLTLYQAGEKIAKHWFCKKCGIQTFSNPRAAPDMYSVNLRCLDDYREEIGRVAVRQFDGRNWENAAGQFEF